MQKLLLACLFCSSIAAAAPMDAVFKEHGGHTRHKPPVFSLAEDDQQDAAFDLSFKREEKLKRHTPGLVKAVPILPINAVMATYTFSIS